MTKPFYITTSIPYVNAAPHIGHAEEFVQADVIARYRRLRGRDVRFLSGTDDNALKNVLKAEESSEPVAQYVSRHADIFEDLLRKLDISNDDFIRTSSDERHAKGAQKLWKAFKPEDVYKKSYKGLYCVGCEEFKTGKDLVNGECPEHPGKRLEEVEEVNYFFKLGNYAAQLEELLVNDRIKITPESRKNEVLAFTRGGLEDLSISRSRARARDWGVPVPGDEDQVMYVWVDALSNYITALGYADEGELYKKYWTGDSDKLHVIGKGISRFHAIYWPAFLLSAGVPLPTELFVHGYLTVDGQKMSKTIGNVIDPLELIEEYGTDAVRYFLARHIHPFEDSDFTHERFKEAYNADLANGLGNQAARIMKLAQDNLDTPVHLNEESLQLQKPFCDLLNKYEFSAATATIWEHITRADLFIQEKKPFSLVKSDDTREEGKQIIAQLVNHLAMISTHLAPIMPETAKKIMTAIKENKKPENLFVRIL